MKKRALSEKIFPSETDWEGSGEEVFRRAMKDVVPLERSKPVVSRRTPRVRRPPGTIPAESEFPEMLRMENLEDSRFHPDYREGGEQIWNRPLMRKLRRGGFSVQAELDLHGMGQKEALAELERFLEFAGRRGLRCVRVIHGKGNNSQNQEGVLKKKVPEWLQLRRLARRIVAFASASLRDGGVGATCVLLRRRRPGR
jgi:DNA-nicking Smr family endonuclease